MKQREIVHTSLYINEETREKVAAAAKTATITVPKYG